MKTKLITFVFALFLLESCASLFPKSHSEFTPDKVEIGMSKSEFLLKFGKPYKQNFFQNEAGEYCQVFFYRETIVVGSSAYGSPVDMDTVFLFVNGKLKSQEQIEVLNYRDLDRYERMNSKYRKDVDLDE